MLEIMLGAQPGAIQAPLPSGNSRLAADQQNRLLCSLTIAAKAIRPRAGQIGTPSLQLPAAFQRVADAIGAVSQCLV